jgi:hypothetical protein
MRKYKYFFSNTKNNKLIFDKKIKHKDLIILDNFSIFIRKYDMNSADCQSEKKKGIIKRASAL